MISLYKFFRVKVNSNIPTLKTSESEAMLGICLLSWHGLWRGVEEIFVFSAIV